MWDGSVMMATQISIVNEQVPVCVIKVNFHPMNFKKGMAL